MIPFRDLHPVFPRAALSLALVLLLATGCVSPGHRTSPPAGLAERLRELDASVDPTEAALAAETACVYSAELGQEYRVVWPPIWHNFLVNIGVRHRGLCYQWADDLSAKLETLHLRTLELHRGVARLETPREHSSVVLTACGQPFDQGIVLDAWRHSGRLYWAGVKEDKYPWVRVVVIPEDEPHGAGTAVSPTPPSNSAFGKSALSPGGVPAQN